MSQAVLEFWQKFVANSVTFFGVNLHAYTAFKSCSMVSFECLWALFSRLAGPLVQGPEKLKPYYEKMLRHASLGGFMYSAETFLKQEDSGPEAIMEYDLTSAYGFSASNALILSGFCTGFLQPKEGVCCLKKPTHTSDTSCLNLKQSITHCAISSPTLTYAQFTPIFYPWVCFTLTNVQQTWWSSTMILPLTIITLTDILFTAAEGDACRNPISATSMDKLTSKLGPRRRKEMPFLSNGSMQ